MLNKGYINVGVDKNKPLKIGGRTVDLLLSCFVFNSNLWVVD
jgi:hypothetical protein